MVGNRSLDEFADAGGSEDDRPDAREDSAESPTAADAAGQSAAGSAAVETEPSTREAGDAPGDTSPERPASTYVWRPDGAPCDACGTTVEERWRDGDALVCADCKEW